MPKKPHPKKPPAVSMGEETNKKTKTKAKKEAREKEDTELCTRLTWVPKDKLKAKAARKRSAQVVKAYDILKNCECDPSVFTESERKGSESLEAWFRNLTVDERTTCSKKAADNTRFASPTSYSEDLSKAFDWLKLAVFIIEVVGKSMNKPTDRFTKGSMIEKALVEFSVDKGRFERVDQVGYDIVDTKHDKKIEVKFREGSIMKPGGDMRDYLQDIRIVNTNSTRKSGDPLLKHPADYYLFLDRPAVILAMAETIEPFLKPVHGAIELVRMPMQRACLLASHPHSILDKMEGRTYPKLVDAMEQAIRILFSDYDNVYDSP